MIATYKGAMAMFGGAAFEAFLFDMDGTLLTSIGASERVWGRWAAGFGLNAATFLPQAHGMRVVEVIERLAIPGVDPVQEADRIFQGELADMKGVAQIAGASAFLASLPPTRWAVVTSAPLALARKRLNAAGLPSPSLIVSAEDVMQGKPNPACYLLAAETLGFAPAACLIFEDAPAGIAAGEAAGGAVFVITGAHAPPVAITLPSARDYRALRVRYINGDGLSLFSTI